MYAVACNIVAYTSFMEICLGFLEPQRDRNLAIPVLWPRVGPVAVSTWVSV